MATTRTDVTTPISAPPHDGAETAIGYQPMTVSEFTNRVVGPRALLGDFAIAGLEQAVHRPSEWSRDWNGYGSRLSAQIGSHVISNSLELGVSAAFHERPARFRLCSCTSTGSRLAHALLTPLRMDSPQGPIYSPIAPLSSVAGSVLITSLQPREFSVSDGLRGGVLGIAGSSLISVAREFWPWHWRPFGW